MLNCSVKKMVPRECFKICNLQVNVQHDTSFYRQMGAIPSDQGTASEYKVGIHTSSRKWNVAITKKNRNVKFTFSVLAKDM